VTLNIYYEIVRIFKNLSPVLEFFNSGTCKKSNILPDFKRGETLTLSLK